MAIKRPQSDCVEHSLKINTLDEKMTTIERHHKEYKENFGDINLKLSDLSVSILMIKNSIEKFNDVPGKLRKLEDKSILLQVFEKLAWIAVGALTVAFINQNFVATREKQEYQIQHEQTR